jgi:prepilin-type N-terminal cleavage/methylation domain-containing protein
MHPRRAFTILELSIALAVAGIVVAAASSTGVMVGRLLKLEAKKSHADADSRRIVDFVLTNLQGVGGGPVRPWMSTWVEPQGCGARNGLPPCLDNDRLTLVDVDFNRGSCTIESVSATMIDFEGPDPVTGLCCYAWFGVPTGGATDQYAHMPLMLVSGREVWTVAIASTEVDASTCQYGLSGISPLSDWTGAVGAAPVPAANLTSAFPPGATATPVVIRTLFVESDASYASRPSRLVEWQDGSVSGASNGIVDDGEVRDVFPGVVRFHMALGYDSNPFDGSVTETGGNDDEWFGNAAGDSMSGLRTSGLRMAEVGVVIALAAVDPGRRSSGVLDGPAFTSDRLMLRRATGRTMLRNVATFF